VGLIEAQGLIILGKDGRLDGLGDRGR